jgi:hypothetical protein
MPRTQRPAHEKHPPPIPTTPPAPPPLVRRRRELPNEPIFPPNPNTMKPLGNLGTKPISSRKPHFRARTPSPCQPNREPLAAVGVWPPHARHAFRGELPNEPIPGRNPNQGNHFTPYGTKPIRPEKAGSPDLICGLTCVSAKLRGNAYSKIMPNPHPTRIAIVETPRAVTHMPLSAGALRARLRIEQANLSRRLTISRSRRIVVNRKEGNRVSYSLPSSVRGEMLDILRHYCQTNLNQSILTMGEMNREAQD